MASQSKSKSLNEIVSPRMAVGGLLLLGLVLFLIHQFVSDIGVFPENLNFGLREPVDEFRSWTIRNNTTHPMFTYFFNPLSDAIDYFVRLMEDALLWLPWATVLGVIFLLSQKIADLRVALLTTACMLLMGLVGLWDESVETLALMVISVVISLLIGIPFGIWAGQNQRVDMILRPFLDAMQTMPAFVYLLPVLLFFGVGRVPSVVATVVYAIPPVLRLTSLGIRHVPDDAIEASRAFGSTPRQILLKVKLPMALPTIMAGVNQTIMMALSIVVIAALIGFGGLGKEVLFALRRVRVGAALEAGLAIVFLAILLDRISYAFSQIEHSSRRQWEGFRLLPNFMQRFWIARQLEAGIDFIYRQLGKVTAAFGNFITLPYSQTSLGQFLQKQSYWVFSLLVLVVLTWGMFAIAPNEEPEIEPTVTTLDFPEAWNLSIRQPVDDAVIWMQRNLYDINDSGIGTGPFSDFIVIYMLNPLRDTLREYLSFPVVFLLVMAAAYAVSSWRMALMSLIGMLAIGGLGMWELAMDTLSQVIVAVFLAVLIGIPIGIWSAKSAFVEAITRVVMDFLQTIPAFVYLVPVIMMFNIGRVPGVIASVLYALPPVVRLTTLGIKQVDAEAVEAAQAYGSTYWQTLRKVQLPLALPSIMVGVNQTMMMVLAMVIVAGLVGGAGLGFQVVDALAQNDLGRGLEAGLAIVIMAILLDRITQAWAQRQAEAVNVKM